MQMDDNFDHSALILENTVPTAPRLVPEITLYLADEDRPLYRAGEDELSSLGIDVPYWAFAWAGGQALARYLLDNPKVVSGRKVLDFGSGSGLVAIAAAMAGAFDVVASDIDPVAMTAIEQNAALNEVWIDTTSEDLIGRHDDWEVLLVGDVFYEKAVADRILPWLQEEKARGVSILLGDPGRFYLQGLGLTPIAGYTAETTGIMEDSDLRNARVWTLGAAASSPHEPELGR